MKNDNNKNFEKRAPQVESVDPVKKQIEETKSYLNLLVNVEELMSQNNKEKIKKIIQNAAAGNLESKSALDAKGYERIDLISTKDGFRLDKAMDENGNIKWNSSIPTYIHNCLPDVILGKFEDDSDKIAIYTIKKNPNKKEKE